MDKPRNWALFLILSVFAVFLMPVWWWLCGGGARSDYWRSLWIKSGMGVIIVTIILLVSWPLWGRLFYVVPSDNPIGLGLLFVLLAVMGSVLTLIGDILVVRRRSKDGSPI